MGSISATLQSSILPAFLSGSTLKERICSCRSKFFPLRVDPILEGLPLPGKQTGSHKSCNPFKNDGKTKHEGVPIYFSA